MVSMNTNDRPLNMAEIIHMLKAGLLSPEQSHIEWEAAYLRAGLPSPYIDNGRGGAYEIIQYPMPPQPCDDEMQLIPYDQLR